LTGGSCEKEDIVKGKEYRRERDDLTAASAAYLNKGIQATGVTLALHSRT